MCCKSMISNKFGLGDLLTRIINTMVIINHSYTVYQNKVMAPHPDAKGVPRCHSHQMEEWLSEGPDWKQFF